VSGARCDVECFDVLVGQGDSGPCGSPIEGLAINGSDCEIVLLTCNGKRVRTHGTTYVRSAGSVIPKAKLTI